MSNRLGIAFAAAMLLLLLVAPTQRAAANGAACVREEAGCRMFNIAFGKDDPNRVLLFEVYENAEAVTAHQSAPAFKKYQATVANMVKSRKRTEMVPLALNAKGH